MIIAIPFLLVIGFLLYLIINSSDFLISTKILHSKKRCPICGHKLNYSERIIMDSQKNTSLVLGCSYCLKKHNKKDLFSI